MKILIGLALIASLSTQAAFATVQDPAMEMSKSMTPAQFAQKLRAMPPEERAELLQTYRTYLANLDKALSQAERYSATHNGTSVEVTVSKTGFGFLIAGAVVLVPSIQMTRSVLVISSFFGQLGLRVAAGLGGVGALLLVGAGTSIGAKKILNAVQISNLRKSIAHIHEQIGEIEILTASK